MDFRRPPSADPTAILPAANAVATFAAAFIIMLVAFVSRDPVTPAVLLIGVAAIVPLSGLTARDLGQRVLPLFVAAAVLGLLNALLAGTPIVGAPAGDASRVEIGLGLGLRIAAIALSGVLAVATTDPADLAGGLVGHLRLSPRLAFGALASLRLVPILGEEWRTIGMARRARGVDAGRNPVRASQLALGGLVILLVSTIRRASRMALAMDARGFDSGQPRTLARPPVMRRRDWLLVAAAFAVGGAAIAISVAVGSWRFLFG